MLILNGSITHEPSHLGLWVPCRGYAKAKDLKYAVHKLKLCVPECFAAYLLYPVPNADFADGVYIPVVREFERSITKLYLGPFYTETALLF